MSLGPPIRKEQPKPEWTPVPGKPHLEQNAKGQLRTVIPVWPFGEKDETDEVVVYCFAGTAWVRKPKAWGVD